MEKIGILDIKGENTNPLTDNNYSDEYKQLAKIWSKYPAYEHAEQIIKSIKDNQVLLITSGTGSGKTVLMPKFCLHVLNYKSKIAVTLPKQIIAKSAAEFAAKTLDVELGQQVGYQFKGADKKGKSDATKLLFATDGTIVSKLLKDPELLEFDGILIDEAHERKVQTDFLLYLLKQVCLKRPSFKLIIMSATVNVSIFKKYYSDFSFAHFDIGGKTNYPIKSIFLDSPLEKKRNSYLIKGYEIVSEILKTTDKGDILFFVTSVNETFEICRKITDDKVFCVEVYAGMKKINQELAQDEHLYKENSKKMRKLVIATNVAESSLTISNIHYVIDSGYEFHNYYNPLLRSRVLDRVLISRAQAIQRMGRSGRTNAGTCYHLYTKNDFDAMIDYPEPSIKISDISGECLKLLGLPNIGTISILKDVLSQFIEPPTKIYVDTAINVLTELNLVSDDVLTVMGKKISEMQLDPIEGIAIYHGFIKHCSKEIIAIFSMINAMKNNINELFYVPPQDSPSSEKFKKAKKRLTSSKGDHIAILKIFNHYIKIKNDEATLQKWLFDHFIKKDVLTKAYTNFKQVRQNVLKHMSEKKLSRDDTDTYDPNIENTILKCLEIAYFVNVASLSKKSYFTAFAESVQISNDSWLKGQTPKKIMYHELFTSNNRSSAVIVSIL
jgi:HrpA-like RNA helicase